MPTARMTSKGQITIPKEVRDKLHLQAGDAISFILDDETGSLQLYPKNKSVMDICGCLSKYRKGKPVTVEEMNESIAEAVRKRWKRKSSGT